MKEATRTTLNTSTLIDIIIINNPSVIAYTKVAPIVVSNHDLISCVRKPHHQKYASKVINGRNTKKYNKELMCDELCNQGWTLVYKSTDVSYSWTHMTDIILSCFEEIAPVIKKCIWGKPSPRLTDEIKNAMNTHDILLRKFRKTKVTIDILAYKKKRNEENSLSNKSKQAYYKDLSNETSSNLHNFWNIIKKLYASDRIKPSPPTTFKIDLIDTSDSSMISNSYCAYFSTTVSSLKKKASSLRDCVWILQEDQRTRTDCRQLKKLHLVSLRCPFLALFFLLFFSMTFRLVSSIRMSPSMRTTQ